jgi:hypothetical protein
MTIRRVNSAFLCIFCLIVLISGCATKGKNAKPVAKSPPIKTIAFVPVRNPSRFEVDKRGGPLSLLPGGRIWRELETSGKSSAFTRRMRELGLTDLGDELTTKIAESLVKRGYQVTVLNNTKIRFDPEDPGHIDYETIKTDADAILNVWVQEAGAFSVLSSLVYRPQLNLGVELVRPGTEGEEIYDDNLVYGAHASKAGHDAIPSDPKHEYKDYDVLMARSAEVAESLRVGAAALAELIATNLEPFNK